MTSCRKSKVSVCAMADWMSSRWRVRRLLFSLKPHDLGCTRKAAGGIRVCVIYLHFTPSHDISSNKVLT